MTDGSAGDVLPLADHNQDAELLEGHSDGMMASKPARRSQGNPI